MQIDITKLKLKESRVDINLQFYFFLKLIVKLKPSDKQVLNILENINLFQNDLILLSEKNEQIFLKSQNKLINIKLISERVINLDNLRLFEFSLKLYKIKDLLLQEAKVSELLDVDKLSKLHPLSLEYDKISLLRPYKTRINGALLSLLFFEKLNSGQINFMSEKSCNFILSLSKEAKKFKRKGIESNQIFMLIFTESINQSIISDSGSNYEERIKSILITEGIENIQKKHDNNDKSTEYDFFFDIDGKSYGIGAKRTLRERYKQFIKTSLTSKIDITIEITLGIDLNESKAKTIVSHKTFIFVSDEIYQERVFLQKTKGIYSVKDLNYKILKSLQKISLD